MNNFVLIVMVAVGFISQGEAPDPFGGITALKDRIKSAVSDIKLHGKRQLFSNYDLSRLKFEQFKPYSKAILKIRGEIDGYVATANRDGWDASRCFKSMTNQLKNLQDSILNRMDRCIDDALEPVNSVKSEIDEYIRTGPLFCSELDGIAGRCISFNSYETERCVLLALISPTQTVKSFVSLGGVLKEKRESSQSSARSSAPRCFQRICSSEIDEKILGIKNETIECIESITGSELQSRDEL